MAVLICGRSELVTSTAGPAEDAGVNGDGLELFRAQVPEGIGGFRQEHRVQWPALAIAGDATVNSGL
jgi:hypothetical protein